MALESRPYIGTYRLDNRKVVKHTPDALVYFNGDISIPGCATCGGRIDLQPYITQVSVDPSVEGPATASMSLHVPRQMGDTLFRDGSFVVHPGLEVHVYLRGFFPVKGLVTQTPEQTGGQDLRNSVMYPYYLVFRGVITEVNHEYNGGEHTASISCADLLHFWQYQRISTSGSLFGARPANSKVRMSLIGHNLTGMSPFAIMYTLFRDVAGAAGGVEFALGSESNAAANSTVVGESLFSLNMLYWQKRFSQSAQNLRMFGADGSLYNAKAASFLAQLSGEQVAELKKYVESGRGVQSNAQNPIKPNTVVLAESLGIDPYSLYASKSTDGTLNVNVADIDAFVSDIGNWGNVNLFESEYQTKLEIANTVKQAVGYEFYQDVDGDIVFKPPFYNLDTSASRVYRIEPIDVISFQAAEREPEATVVKATGSWFKNLKVPGIDGWVGTRGQYIDYRLVAQFGWREQTFETSYHTNPIAMFFSCISRLDLFNIGIRSATVTIPIRPELRPGYPVYVEHLDCFYYVQSLSHSFSFGGQCTTTLNLVGRRAKFHAPGKPPNNGSSPTVENVDLANTHLPALPLPIRGYEGIPRIQGFPNVVMTLDPEQVNPLTFARGITIDDISSVADVEALIKRALFSRKGLLQQVPDSTAVDERAKAQDGPFQIQTGNGTDPIVLSDLNQLVRQARDLRAAYDTKNSSTIATAEESAQALIALIDAAQDVHDRNFPEEGSTAAYLELVSDLKAAFNPGLALPGNYRYYSSSHPDPSQQGPLSISVSDKGTISTGTRFQLDETFAGRKGLGFPRGTEIPEEFPVELTVEAGIPIPVSDKTVVVTPTYAITSFTMAQFEIARENSVVVTLGQRPAAFPSDELSNSLAIELFAKMQNDDLGPATALSNFEDLFEAEAARLTAAVTNISVGFRNSNVSARLTGVTPTFTFPAGTRTTLDEVDGDDAAEKGRNFAREMGANLAQNAAAALFETQKATAALSATGNLTEAQTLAITAAWAKCYPANLQPRRDQNPGSEQAKKEKGKKTLKYAVPVFPVSDERGYEVVGTYRYGRGLSIESGGNMEALLARDVRENTDWDAVDAAVRDLLHPTDRSKSAGTSSAERMALVSTEIDQETDPSQWGVLDMSDGSPGKDVIAMKGANRPANANQSTQKLAVSNAAYNLADLSAQVNRLDVCSCKGAEADVLLQAFSSDLFVTSSLTTDVGDTEAVQDWLTDQAVAQSVGWAATQAAYRGQTLDTTSATWSAAGDAINKFGTLIGKGATGVSTGTQWDATLGNDDEEG